MAGARPRKQCVMERWSFWDWELISSRAASLCTMQNSPATKTCDARGDVYSPMRHAPSAAFQLTGHAMQESNFEAMCCVLRSVKEAA